MERHFLPLFPERFRPTPKQLLGIVHESCPVVPPHEDPAFHGQQLVRQWAEDNPVLR